MEWNEEWDIIPETIFGIEVFNAQDGEFIGETYEYSQVEFLIPSLKKYDGKAISVTPNWDVKVWAGEGDDKPLGETIAEFNLIEVSDFREKLKEKMAEF